MIGHELRLACSLDAPLHCGLEIGIRYRARAQLILILEELSAGPMHVCVPYLRRAVYLHTLYLPTLYLGREREVRNVSKRRERRQGRGCGGVEDRY